MRNDFPTIVTAALPPSPVVQPAPLIDRAELDIAARLMEKDSLYRPKMSGLLPEDCRKVLVDYPLYQAQNNGKGKPLRILLQNMIGPMFMGDKIPEDLSDQVIIAKLKSYTPPVTSKYVHKYFQDNVSMGEKKDANLTAQDVFKYLDAFAKFVHHFADYWTPFGEEAFKLQRDTYFLEGLRPRALQSEMKRDARVWTDMPKLVAALLSTLQTYSFPTSQKTPPKSQSNNA